MLYRMLLCIVLLSAAVTLQAQESIACMSYNIRYDNPQDGMNNWHNRKQELVNMLQDSAATFIGLQECLWHQLQFIDSALINYTYIGVGRDDGKLQGEFSPILYDSTVFELQSATTKWLSVTPDTPSVGWDAALPRIVTIGVFRHKINGKLITVANTHFDYIGEQARLHAAELIMQQISNEEHATVLMGDFNSTPDEAPYKTLTGQFRDTRYMAAHTGPDATFNGFSVDGHLEKCIDYIFVKGLSVAKQQHIVAKKADGLWMSDHIPVMTTCLF